MTFFSDRVIDWEYELVMKAKKSGTTKKKAKDNILIFFIIDVPIIAETEPEWRPRTS